MECAHFSLHDVNSLIDSVIMSRNDNTTKAHLLEELYSMKYNLILLNNQTRNSSLLTVVWR